MSTVFRFSFLGQPPMFPWKCMEGIFVRWSESVEIFHGDFEVLNGIKSVVTQCNQRLKRFLIVELKTNILKEQNREVFQRLCILNLRFLTTFFTNPIPINPLYFFTLNKKEFVNKNR